MCSAGFGARMSELANLRRVLLSWGYREGVLVEPLKGGLINRTWLVSTGNERLVLQWVNPIFPPEVTDDMVAVTQHLIAHGVETFRVLPTQSGGHVVAAATLFDDAKGSYRLLSYLEGVPPQESDLGPASIALGRFHAVLSTLTHTFAQIRDIHNTPEHVAALQGTLEKHSTHRLMGEVAPLATVCLRELHGLVHHPKLPPRSVHGDPKRENFLLVKGHPVLLDLDTVGPHSLFGELGDFVRSWCNQEGEFSLDLFQLFWSHWSRGFGVPLTEGERELLGTAPLVITLELACRFLRDSLEESYFAWDPNSFPSAGAHNIARAKRQLQFALSMIPHRSNMERIVRS